MTSNISFFKIFGCLPRRSSWRVRRARLVFKSPVSKFPADSTDMFGRLKAMALSLKSALVKTTRNSKSWAWFLSNPRSRVNYHVKLLPCQSFMIASCIEDYACDLFNDEEIFPLPLTLHTKKWIYYSVSYNFNFYNQSGRKVELYLEEYIYHKFTSFTNV